ncbi:GDNF family receptor alpha-1b [Stigmatopora argus]
MILATFTLLLSLPDLATTSKGVLDCVKANEQCLKEAGCSTKYRTMRQCVAGRHSVSGGALTAPESQGECRSAMDAIKHNPLSGCRCKRGMKKEKNCLRIFWSIYQSLQGNDLLEYSPYEPVNSHLSDVFRLAPIIAAEPASSKENNCLNAAKACNLNDTCKKYRSAYINPCTGRVSASEVCNKRKCHKALRHFFDKVPTKYSYGMLFCSCPAGDEMACAERRRQTIVPACSYEDKDKSNCLSLQKACKTNYICRSRLADFISSCQLEARSVSGCLRENYADCLLAYSGLIGTVITPNYERSLGISPSPWCDCSSSGNDKPECDKFLSFFTDNICLRNAIQAFGNGTDVGAWKPPIEPTLAPAKDEDKPDLNADTSYHICETLQAQKLTSNRTEDSILCTTGGSNAIARSSSRESPRASVPRLLLALSLAPTFQMVGVTLL